MSDTTEFGERGEIVYVVNAGGTPSIQEGPTRSRPIAGILGRLFLDINKGILYRDTGRKWVALQSGPQGEQGIVGPQGPTLNPGCNANTVGACSFAEGNDTTANGVASHAEGNNTIAGGVYSHTEGDTTKANGIGSHAEGNGAIAGGVYSHAEGNGTTADGGHSHAEGHGAQTTTTANFSHAEGNATIASGVFSHTEGDSTKANGIGSHAEGNGTTADGGYSHVEGNGAKTTTLANFSHAEGHVTIANGIGSHAEGNGTTADGGYSHTEGNGAKTTTLANFSHAEGVSTTAGGVGSHAEGENTTASGKGSHAEGYSTTASGEYSHAEGLNTSTNFHVGSHIIGRNGIATEDYSWFLASGITFPLPSSGLAAKILSDGNGYAQIGWSGGGFDYAEMFETVDGQPIDNGYFVTLEEEKIRKANSNDDYILGIISATSSFIGDSGELMWKNKLMTDEWGVVQYHDVVIPEVKDIDGNIIMAERTEKQPILNPEFDDTKEYISRLKRPEWVVVGLMGKLLLRDDGTCLANGYCKPNDDGIATASNAGYKVMKRTGLNQILILLR